MRDELLKRFWPDTDTKRVSLRMALSSLRASFGKDVILTDGDRVKILKERFRLDLDLVEKVSAQARLCTNRSERLALLKAVEASLTGEFLEGCHDPDESTARWIGNQRAYWHQICATLLLTLSQDLNTDGNPYAAFEAACRSVRYAPQSEEAWQSVWQVGRLIGRTSDVHALQSTLTFAEALQEVTKSDQISLKDERVFKEMLWGRLQTLTSSQKTAFFALSVHPGKFRLSLAQNIAPISATLVRRLVSMQVLEMQGEYLFVHEHIRNILWTTLSAKEQKRLLGRLRVLCSAWLHIRPHGNKEHFHSYDEADEHLMKILRWQLETPPTTEVFAFMCSLSEGFSRASLKPYAQSAIHYCLAAVANPTLSIAKQHHAAYTGGQIAFAIHDFTQAQHFFLFTVEHIYPEVAEVERAKLHFALAMSYHHGGLKDKALFYVRQATEIARATGYLQGVAHTLRFEGEILSSLENYEWALELQEQALEQSRTVCPPSIIAECLYQRGVIQRRLGNIDEAIRDQEEALAIRMSDPERLGIADSLCEMAHLRATQGDFLWAYLTMDHARALYERVNNVAGVAALLIGLGDIHLSNNQREEAVRCWQDALERWQKIGHQVWIEKAQERLLTLGSSAL